MDNQDAFNEFHWIMAMVQTIDAGLVVLDKSFQVKLWNDFMENHSGIRGKAIKEGSLFQHFPELPENWLRKKVESVFLLKNNAFTSWEQRPYIFRFNNYRPVTGISEFMYQNMTIIPLPSLTGEVTHVSLIIYDVTDIAVNKLQLDKANEKLAKLSNTDQLTQLNNRRNWDRLITKEHKRARRYGLDSTLMMLDIDHFKNINDHHGHLVGDKVLSKLAAILQAHTRETDFSARYGGEEFAICLTNTGLSDARLLAEKIRESVEKCEIIDNNNMIKVTVSIGLSALSPQINTAEQWIKNADQALYVCKEQGRNQCQALC